jgi:hypothetical protein
VDFASNMEIGVRPVHGSDLSEILKGESELDFSDAHLPAPVYVSTPERFALEVRILMVVLYRILSIFLKPLVLLAKFSVGPTKILFLPCNFECI